MNSILLREGKRGCSLLLATAQPGKECEHGQEADTGENYNGESQHEVDDVQFGKRGICRGRADIRNRSDAYADNEESPNIAQHTPQPAADLYPPVAGGPRRPRARCGRCLFRLHNSYSMFLSLLLSSKRN